MEAQSSFILLFWKTKSQWKLELLEKIWQFQPATTNPSILNTNNQLIEKELHKISELLFMLTVNKKKHSKIVEILFFFSPCPCLSSQKSSNQLCNQFFNTTLCAPWNHSLKLLLGLSLSIPHFTFLGKKKTTRRLCGLTFFTGKRPVISKMKGCGAFDDVSLQRAVSTSRKWNQERKMSWHWMTLI